MKSTELITEARRWLGVPFRHQGRSKLGVDCAGFLEMLLATSGCLPAGYKAPRNYDRRPNGELLEVVKTYCVRTKQDPQRVPGSLVLICWQNDKEPSHVALSTGATLIHSYMRVRCVVENGYRGVWVRDTHSAWLLPGVEYV